MGYRSNVYLKTVEGGYETLRRFNNCIENEHEKPLKYARIEKTQKRNGIFYKISFIDVKWYEGEYEDVNNFMKGLEILEEQEIPFSYIRVGEDVTDIEHKINWTDYMPDEIICFEPITNIKDIDNGNYKKVE